MFEHFRAGICAAGQFERLVAAAGEMLADRNKLVAAQQESARFVREWHKNEANVHAFLSGLSK
jgi:hypothetical protein